MAKLEEKVEGIDSKVDDLKATIRDFIKSADEKYAPKWVADALKWAIALIVGAVLLALIALVIK